MRLRRLPLAATTLLVGLSIPGPASAAPGEGATVTVSSSCRDFREGVICSQSRWVENDTRTPSGNYISTAIGDSSFVYTGSDGCTWTSSQTKREHWLSSGGIQEAHVLQITSSTNSCFGENIQCTDTVHFLTANDASRIYQHDVSCAPL